NTIRGSSASKRSESVSICTDSCAKDLQRKNCTSRKLNRSPRMRNEIKKNGLKTWNRSSRAVFFVSGEIKTCCLSRWSNSLTDNTTIARTPSPERWIYAAAFVGDVRTTKNRRAYKVLKMDGRYFRAGQLLSTR